VSYRPGREESGTALVGKDRVIKLRRGYIGFSFRSRVGERDIWRGKGEGKCHESVPPMNFELGRGEN